MIIDPLVITLIVMFVLGFLLIILANTWLGKFWIRILISVGLISAVMVYIKPELDKTGDSNLQIMMWSALIFFFIVFNVIISRWFNTMKKHKERAEALEDENKRLRKRGG